MFTVYYFTPNFTVMYCKNKKYIYRFPSYGYFDLLMWLCFDFSYIFVNSIRSKSYRNKKPVNMLPIRQEINLAEFGLIYVKIEELAIEI